RPWGSARRTFRRRVPRRRNGRPSGRRGGRTLMAVLTTRRVGFGVLTVLVMLALTGGVGGRTPAAGQSPGPIKIGFIYPDKGPLAQLGIDLRDGFLLYWSEVGNKAGGRPVEHILETKTSNKPHEGRSNAGKRSQNQQVPTHI